MDIWVASRGLEITCYKLFTTIDKFKSIVQVDDEG